MSMPAPNTPWPPEAVADAFTQIAADSAWLSGDMDRIRARARAPRQQAASTPWQFNGGLGGAAARAVYGKPRRTPGSATIDRHLPVPLAVCAASANLLVGTPPAITLHPEDEANAEAEQLLVEETTTDEWAAQLTRAAMYCAGLGWVFGRVVWDTEVRPTPWVEWVDADRGVVEWRHGRPAAITFWDAFEDPEGRRGGVWRLLQRHTPGRIDYALYRGSGDNLGQLMPLTEHPSAAFLADLVDAEGGVRTGTAHMTAVLIPNIDGNPTWRDRPQLRGLGLSDIAAAGDVWADIDKIYTDLLHEVDSARARLLVSEEYMQDAGPGRGLSFDWGRDVWPLATTGLDGGSTIQQVQFQMRVAEYEQALQVATRRAFDAVGLSPITVGQDPGQGAMTATEIRARSTATLNTWRRKARMWRAGLSQLVTAWVGVDAALRGYAPLTRPVNVALTEPVQDTELDKAQTLRELRDARAVSTEYVVERMHPEWTPEQCATEVQRIRAEEAGGGDPLGLMPPDGM
ncbi:hypothetical protein C1Y63_04780 [Corynebacterium sp. 13CS0277]|uniref:phage portal protein n=1 Tax=Corynebacterium sp. 13CS0277 TaxID=2071994 RepID=UPI000D0381F4|nr:phage portal protein [Corynebacterium sp. 13CS0277]PRQ11726.1 hypothetical protein C1Y63_04780 [Corynebacterium sp. 13CS0277]